jgi:hypothetical protein
MSLFFTFLVLGVVVLAIAFLFAYKQRASLDQTFDTARRKMTIYPDDENPTQSSTQTPAQNPS